MEVLAYKVNSALKNALTCGTFCHEIYSAPYCGGCPEPIGVCSHPQNLNEDEYSIEYFIPKEGDKILETKLGITTVYLRWEDFTEELKTAILQTV